MDRARQVTAELYSAQLRHSPGTVVCVAAQLDGRDHLVGERRRPDDLVSPISPRSDRGVSAPACTGNAGTGETAVICAFTTTGSTVLAHLVFLRIRVVIPEPRRSGWRAARLPVRRCHQATWPIVSSKAMTRASSADAFKGAPGWPAAGLDQRHGRHGERQCQLCRRVGCGVGVRSDRFQQRSMPAPGQHHWSGSSKVGASTPTSNASCATLEHQPGGLRDQGKSTQVYERRRPVR